VISGGGEAVEHVKRLFGKYWWTDSEVNGVGIAGRHGNSA
jgi:hypothetical protein